MRQTIEDAAKDYAIRKTSFRKNVLKEVDADDYVLREDDCRSKQVLNGKWQKLLMLTGKVVQTSLKTMT